MSAWIEGLLGAVMGGASSIEKSLAEEEAAKRKEEEEKRREERAISLKEREAKMKQEMDRKLEEEKQKRFSGYMAPQEQTGISQSPDEPEGMVTREMKGGDLRTAITRAGAEGRFDDVKVLSEELNRQIRRDIDLSEEARKLVEQEQKAAKRPEEPASLKEFRGIADLAYGGKRDEQGRPADPEDYKKFLESQARAKLKKETYIKPETGEKPLTGAQRDAQETRVGNIVSDLSTVTAGGKKVKDPDRENLLNNILSQYKSDVQKSGKDFYSIDLNDVKIELSKRANAAEKSAKDRARAEFNKYIEDPQKSPLSVQDPVAMAAASKALNVKKDEKKLNAFRSMFVDQAYKSYLSDFGVGRPELPDPLGIRTR